MPPNHLTPDLPQRWRLRTARSGREVVLAADPGVRYIDRYTGEEMVVTGQLLPLAPSPSRLGIRQAAFKSRLHLGRFRLRSLLSPAGPAPITITS